MSTNYIDQITDTAGTTHDISEGDSTRIFRATCTTAAGTAAKVATLDTSNRNFSLTAGVRVAVTFKYGNSATTPTLRIDGSSTGTAKTIAIWANDSSIMTAGGASYYYWGPYETIIFTYDGTYWIRGDGGAIYKAYALADSKTANTGTVTSIATSSPISGGTITTTGTISHATSGVGNGISTAGFYKFKYDTYGHVTGVSAVTASDITGLITIPTDTNTTYALSGALSSHKFTSTLTAGGSGSGTSTSDFTLAAGTGITITDDTSNRKMTIACSVTNTDEKVSTAATAASTTYYPTLGTNTTNAETKYYDTGLSYYQYAYGARLYVGTSSKKGEIYIYGGTNNSGTQLTSSGETANTWYSVDFPAKGGTVALTSDMTDEKVSTAAITAGTTYYPILGTDTTSATTKYYDANAFSYKTNDSEKTATLIIGNNLATDNSNYRKASIELYSNTKSGMIQMENLTHNQTYVLPDTSGMFAMVSDVPKIQIVRW